MLTNRITKIGFYRPLCFVNDELYCYKNNKIFVYKNNNMVFFKRFKISGYRGFFSKTRFLTRIFHRYIYCGIYPKNSDFFFVAANNGVYKVFLDTRESQKVFEFKQKDMHRPLSFFEIKDIDSFDDAIVFGEYCYNKDRKDISLVVYNLKNDCWDVAYTFSGIRHIHSVIPDKYRDRVLVFTGDKDKECGVYEFKDNFHSVRTIMSGNQQLRFCCGKAYEKNVILATDSPFEQNYVYSLSNDMFTKLYKIPGPTVFFTDDNDDLYFATDVENDEKNLSPFSEFFINKKGDGVLDDYSHLYKYNPVDGVNEIMRFKKDFLPMRLFGFGTVHFPTGFSPDGNLFCYPMAVRKYDQCLIKIVNYEKN